MIEEKNKNTLNLDDINEILSETLLDISKKRISLKRAQVISRTALALSKNITNTELKDRIEFLEEVFRNKK
jgi:hypothetical protein